MSITLCGIATRSKNKAPMGTFQSARVVETGLVGNFYINEEKRLKSKRQVTVISLYQWQEAMQEIGQDLPWQMRRANLCVTEHEFSEKDVGRKLRVGRSVVLEITGELDPCPRMDEIFDGLQEALHYPFRGGVACRVVTVGEIFLNDSIFII